MRIYNGTKAFIDLPLSNRVRLTIPSHSVSKDFMPSEEFLNMIVTLYTENKIALIVSGPYELNMCAKNPALSPLIVYSLDEAVIRFNGSAKVEGDKEDVKEVFPEFPTKTEEKEEIAVEEETATVESDFEDTPVEEEPKKEEEQPKKKTKKNKKS